MSDLLHHATYELKRAGFFDPDSDYDGAVGPVIIELMQVFVNQQHSGMSASIVLDLFSRLVRFEPLSPLTGEDDEWLEMEDDLFQNKRDSAVFKRDGVAYDSQGIFHHYPDGHGRYVRMPITFPYMKSETIYVDVDTQDKAIEQVKSLEVRVAHLEARLAYKDKLLADYKALHEGR